MTARLLLIFGVVSLSLVFGSRQYSSGGPIDAEECPSDDPGNQSCMVGIESGEEVCVDGLKLGSQQDQKEQADSYAAKPLGGDIPAVRSIVDPHPAFVGVAVDSVNDIVVVADTNRKSVVSYDRRLGQVRSDETSEMRRQIIGP